MYIYIYIVIPNFGVVFHPLTTHLAQVQAGASWANLPVVDPGHLLPSDVDRNASKNATKMVV